MATLAAVLMGAACFFAAREGQFRYVLLAKPPYSPPWAFFAAGLPLTEISAAAGLFFFREKPVWERRFRWVYYVRFSAAPFGCVLFFNFGFAAAAAGVLTAEWLCLAFLMLLSSFSDTRAAAAFLPRMLFLSYWLYVAVGMITLTVA